MTTQALQDNHLFQTGYLVNGIWKTLDTTFDVLNPATGEVIARVAKAGKAETEDAIAAAAKAFPAWRAKTAKARSAILYRWYELIIENKSWLGRLMTTEQGKPLKEAEGEGGIRREFYPVVRRRGQARERRNYSTDQTGLPHPGDPRAHRRGCGDYAVELPDGHAHP
ncbi:acyl-CoA reductase-like NAD-dependent aldehyde dehydrogenase [Enterobacter sp. SORGH_AS 287]|nr:acyl-CoA reductase-like NAD-dependent aldehyde dehydrogenase [Enterobacter sp. SORGH_AS_0287]